MGIQINGQTDTISASDGGLAVSGYELTGASNINVTGIVTATTFNGDVKVATGSTISGGTNYITASTNGSERLRITSSGFVGVGTTTFDSASESLRLENSGGTTHLSVIATDTSAGLSIVNLGDSDDYNIGRIDYNHSNNSLNFRTNNNTRATINSSGQLIVGQGTTVTTLTSIEAHKPNGGSNYLRIQSGAQGSNELQDGEEVSFAAVSYTNSNSRQGKIGAYKHSGITNSAGYIFLDQQDGGNSFLWAADNGVLRISSTITHIGTTSGSAVGDQTSDERLKNVGENVAYGLNEILQLQPKQYTLKTEPDTNKLGFIAQEVLPIIPEAVFDTNEELEGHQEGDSTKLGMQYVQLIPVLVNAIKEQQETITDLQTRLAALEAQ